MEQHSICNKERATDSSEDYKIAELTTTVDPSHVIRLIRQLLPGKLYLHPPCSSHDKDGKAVCKRFSNVHIQNECTSKRQEEMGDDEEGREVSNALVASAGEKTREADRVEKAMESETTHCADDGGKVAGSKECNAVSSSEESEEDGEEAMEEAGCVLWDLAVSTSHADFLVYNHILEVLLLVLQSAHSDRRREVALGILGNLACHQQSQEAMVKVDGLVAAVAKQLFVDDPPSLTETCRLLSAGLHSHQSSVWVSALEPDHVLKRVMWIVANTLHAPLLEKSTELILAMVDGGHESSSSPPPLLLSSLLRLDLVSLLTEAIQSELEAVVSGTSSHGDTVLDTLLQIAEVLSLMDDCCGQLAGNRKLFSLACQVVRLAPKEEIGPSGITSTVLVANLLAEDSSLVHQVARDVVMAASLLALLPQVSDDPGARNALWSILGRSCGSICEREDDAGVALAGMAAALAEGYSAVVEDLEGHLDEDRGEEVYVQSSSSARREEHGRVAEQQEEEEGSTSRGLDAKLNTVRAVQNVRNMILVMERWGSTRGQSSRHGSKLLDAVQLSCAHLSRLLQTMAHSSSGSGRDGGELPPDTRGSSHPQKADSGAGQTYS